MGSDTNIRRLARSVGVSGAVLPVLGRVLEAIEPPGDVPPVFLRKKRLHLDGVERGVGGVFERVDHYVVAEFRFGRVVR